MRQYIKEDNWKIIEEEFSPEYHKSSESLFSLGNGHMGQRANFEEKYSGDSLQGHYLAGIYYPDKTKVGWWKIGYPEYFAKVLNAPAWIGIHLTIDGEDLDLYQVKVSDFQRILDMKRGLLIRSFIAEFTDNKQVRVTSERFLSLATREIGAIRYELTPLNFSGTATVDFLLDADISNEDANYDEKFWEPVSEKSEGNFSHVTARTKKTDFLVSTAQHAAVTNQHTQTSNEKKQYTSEKQSGIRHTLSLAEQKTLTLTKIACITTSRDYDPDDVEHQAYSILKKAVNSGYDALREEHIQAWAEKWVLSDIKIDGDPSAQQGIRFNIFQLIQTYSGHDARLNIGPKGFTGEKYGGSTYWDTEAYCLPFYLSTADQHIAKNLLLYRYNQLDKAIENARKLGFDNGAALFPMVTMNGEESHNEWEITFEEIHRNGAIAYAIMNYIRHTGDEEYLFDYGLEVLIAISRFWAQRVNYAEKRNKFVMLGVTGPNEYENNVNNNWYTNYIAVWTLQYTLESIARLEQQRPGQATPLFDKLRFNKEQETSYWKEIVANIHLPQDSELGIYLQQDGYLDKVQMYAEELAPFERPINQHWSWDRILRSCFIKQADVLQGIYFFQDDFDTETIRRNFDFYEPRTVHESSLSPCVHVVLAAKLNKADKAYELYLRTSRLDLDDYNNEVHEGCHITSMAGTWLSVVEGFGGMRVNNNELHFDPLLPSAWKSLHFKVHFRSRLFDVHLTHDELTVTSPDGEPCRYFVSGKVRVTQ